MEHAHTATQATIQAVTYLRWIVFLPLIGVLFNIFFAPKFGRRVVNLVAPGVILGAFVFAWTAFEQLSELPPGSALVDNIYPWITTGQLHVDFALRVDALTAVMILIITGVGALIHIYSTGYMAHDEDVSVTSPISTCLRHRCSCWCWEKTCSYFLSVGKGWDCVPTYSSASGIPMTKKPVPGRKRSSLIALVMPGFYLACSFSSGHWSPTVYGPSRLAKCSVRSPNTLGSFLEVLPPRFASCSLLGQQENRLRFRSMCGFPMMAGPTPVSALIHAATMVTAGVYMIARLHFLYELSPTALSWVSWIAAITAILAASIALVQTDIKKVLAYSTVSQLGYMFLGVGVGAYGAGIFHLMTHAFFKALLFLGAGSVIHGMSEEQDIRKMGGLLKRMPITGWTFLLGCLAIAGVPFFSGYYSKDLILEEVYAGPHAQPLLYWVGTIGAGMTAFYMFRLFL